MENLMNEKVIIRADRAGVFYGELKEKEGCEVTLINCRRIWRWSGANSLSELAVSGTKNSSECKFTKYVDEIRVLGVIEIIQTTEEAQKSIEGVEIWEY